jgi:acyl-coenzyme A thioesterase PaaI-like protein
MKPSTLRLGMNLWPPFLFTGIHVAAISPDWRHARVELRLRPWNRNYVGTHFGGSLFAMTDPFWMLLLMPLLGRDYYVWDQSGTIDFLKPGRGTVTTRFDIDDAVLEEIRQATAGGAKYLHWFENEVVDADGDVVARVRKQVYVRRKPDRRPAQGDAPAA